MRSWPSLQRSPAQAGVAKCQCPLLFCPPPTTSQSVFPDEAAHRKPVTGVCILRRSCGGNRRTPLLGESERVLPQSGHSTEVTELSAHRLGSMGTTVRENMHLGEVLVC